MEIFNLGIDVVRLIVQYVKDDKARISLTLTCKAIYNITKPLISSNIWHSSIIISNQSTTIATMHASTKLTITTNNKRLRPLTSKKVRRYLSLDNIKELTIHDTTQKNKETVTLLPFPTMKNVETLTMTGAVIHHTSLSQQFFPNLTSLIITTSTSSSLEMDELPNLINLNIITNGKLHLELPHQIKNINIKAAKAYILDFIDLDLDELTIETKHSISMQYISDFKVKKGFINGLPLG
jgi:uncharacterized protein YifN (PemK superfamily)